MLVGLRKKVSKKTLPYIATLTLRRPLVIYFTQDFFWDFIMYVSCETALRLLFGRQRTSTRHTIRLMESAEVVERGVSKGCNILRGATKIK